MFKSLRARLGLSYLLIITIVILVLLTGIIVSLLGKPLVYRNVSNRLRISANAINLRVEYGALQNEDRLEKVLLREAANRGTRYLIIDQQGKIVFDTEPGQMIGVLDVRSAINEDPLKVSTFRDGKGQVWIYAAQWLADGRAIVAAEQRPAFRLRTLLRDDLIRPFLLAMMLAVVLAFGLSIIMAEWITRPLVQIADDAEAMTLDPSRTIQSSGPLEVQRLSRALNSMLKKVLLSQQVQRDFLADISHELKTPLTSIQGFSQAILDGVAASPEQIHSSAEIIHLEASRLHRMTLDLLSLARLESGSVNLHFEKVDLTQLTLDCISRFEPVAKVKNVKLVPQTHEPIEISADGDKLAQAFSNLIDNAIKFTKENSEVDIRVYQSGEGAVFEIEDQGEGISESDLPRIFDRFYQVKKSRSNQTRTGVGLGLAICKQIIMAHNANISIASKAGQGTKFVVKFPVAIDSNFGHRGN